MSPCSNTEDINHLNSSMSRRPHNLNSIMPRCPEIPNSNVKTSRISDFNYTEDVKKYLDEMMLDIVPRISALNDTRTLEYPISMMPRTRGMRHCLNSIMTKRTHILQSMMPRPPELVNSIMPRCTEILNSIVLQKHQQLLTSIMPRPPEPLN